jgi:hypothetical protein
MVRCSGRSRFRHTVHGNAPDNVLAQMLRYLKHKLVATIVGRERIENSRELLGVELDVNLYAVVSGVFVMRAAVRSWIRKSFSDAANAMSAMNAMSVVGTCNCANDVKGVSLCLICIWYTKEFVVVVSWGLCKIRLGPETQQNELFRGCNSP